jgi:hypothetical protein
MGNVDRPSRPVHNAIGMTFMIRINVRSTSAALPLANLLLT